MSAASKARFLLRNSIRPLVGWKNWNSMQFRALHGYKPDFKNPSTFLEYLQYLKYFGGGGELAPFVDKLAVKDFVRKRIGQQYVIPTDTVIYPNEDLRFSSLPSRWIAKSAHAAGWNHLHNGGQIDEQAVRRKIRRWLARSYFTVSGETNYRYIAPKVLIEPLISEPDEDLKDYKIWCFAGDPLLIGVHGNRKATPRGQIYNVDWQATNWSYPGIPPWDKTPHKPKNFDLLLDIARALSRDFPFVRVDLYDGAQGVFFGEMTFTPGDGNNIRIPYTEDLEFGKKVLHGRGNRSIDVSYTMELHH